MKTIFLTGNLGMLMLYVSFIALLLSIIIMTMLNFAVRRRIRTWWHIMVFILLALVVPVGILKYVTSFIWVM